MMRKFAGTLLLISAFTVAAPHNASAWILMKISNMAEDVTTALTKVQKKAQNALDQVNNAVIVQKIGKGFAEAKEFTESYVSQVKSFKDTVGDDIAAYKKMYEDSKAAYENSIGGYKKVYDDINDLKAEKENIEAAIEEQKASLSAEFEGQKSLISGQISSCEQNMSNLKQLIAENSTNKEQYEKEYNEWKEKKDSLSTELNNLDDQAQQALDQVSAAFNNQLSTIDSKLNQLESDLSKLVGMSEEESSDEDALLRTADVYFLQFDEELNPERQDHIRKNRLRERRDSIIGAYKEALKQKTDLVIKNNEAEDLGYNASTFDTTAGAWGADAQLRIDNLKALSAYAHLLVQDLKRQTAIEMTDITFYKLQREQKNIAEFTLDDYVYEKGDK